MSDDLLPPHVQTVSDGSGILGEGHSHCFDEVGVSVRCTIFGKQDQSFSKIILLIFAATESFPFHVPSVPLSHLVERIIIGLHIDLDWVFS